MSYKMRKAQLFSQDIIFAMVLVLFIFSIWLVLRDRVLHLISTSEYKTELDEATSDALSQLLETSGKPTNWNRLPTINETTAGSIGLASDRNALDSEKVNKFVRLARGRLDSSSLAALWHFNEESGNTTYDSSGNGNMGTFTGTTTTTATLILSSTNKAYIISSTATDNPNIATTEFSSAQYTSINTSNDNYVTSTAQESITYAGCTMSDNTWQCCLGSTTCSHHPNCAVTFCGADACDIGNCAALTNASQLSSSGCSLSTSPLAECYCGEVNPGYCDGSSGTCTISGSCSYICTNGYYSCDNNNNNGCETTSPCYIYTFQRYTFNLSSVDWNSVTELDFCWEGKYDSAGGLNGSQLYWWNVTSASWSLWQTLPYNAENTYCISFSGANLTNVYNSTGTWVQFAARGNQSKTGHTLTLSGDYAYLNLNTVTLTAPWTVGKFGNAINFNGSGTYGQVNDSNSLDITDQLTIEAWINPATVTPPYQVIVHKGNSSTENYGLYLKGDEVYFEWVNSGLESAETTLANLQADNWYHIAAVFNYSGSSLKLYVDGAENASSSPSANLLAGSTALEIGANNSANYFNGTIDEIAIYSRAKSADEIAADYADQIAAEADYISIKRLLGLDREGYTFNFTVSSLSGMILYSVNYTPSATLGNASYAEVNTTASIERFALLNNSLVKLTLGVWIE